MKLNKAQQSNKRRPGKTSRRAGYRQTLTFLWNYMHFDRKKYWELHSFYRTLAIILIVFVLSVIGISIGLREIWEFISGLF